MPIDNTIQFNGYNSYRVTETVWSAPFGVQGMAYITHSFNVYATSPLGAATRARTRFFAADGSITGTSDHSFAVPAVFTAVALTLAVPANSVLCQLSFITSGTWWIAAPKSEEGQTASPYNTNYAAQLSLITPNGAYLGMLTTAQIVVAGTLADPTESLYSRLVTINSNAITLTASQANNAGRLTQIEAGVITVSGSATYAAGYDPTTKETPAGSQAKVNALGATLGDMAFEDLVAYSKLGTTIISGGYLQTVLINADMIQAGTIQAARIAAGSITGAKIAADTIESANIKAGTIQASDIAVGTITAASGVIGSIDASKIVTGTLDASLITVINMIAQTLTNSPAADFYAVTGDLSVSGRTEKGILGYLKSYSTTEPLFSLTCFRGASAKYATLKLANNIITGWESDAGTKVISMDTGDALMYMSGTINYTGTRVGGAVAHMIGTTDTGVFYSNADLVKHWLT